MPNIDELAPYLKKLSEGIHYLKRAMQGLPPEEDNYAGMMNIHDIKERTRIDIHNIYAHSFMRELHSIYPEEFSLFKDIADLEDTYFISKDGEQRKEAILLQKAKSQTNPETLQIVPIDTQTPLTQESHKKHFWSRGEKKNEPNA